ncbi:unnamed protein product [Ectocarpus sp. 4 AP-2014]
MSRRRVVMKQQKPQGGGMQAAMKEMANFEDGMPTPYIPPDKNTLYVRPAEALRKMDVSKLIVIWPNNVDSTKTIKRGRRIPKASGCPSPTVEDMSQVLEFLQLWHAVEPYKAYPREQWILGRVRVRLADEDGVPWNPEVPDRPSLMKKMGELMPNLKSRIDRISKAKKDAEALARAEKEKAAAAVAAASQSNMKKKGKKKGKR